MPVANAPHIASQTSRRIRLTPPPRSPSPLRAVSTTHNTVNDERTKKETNETTVKCPILIIKLSYIILFHYWHFCSKPAERHFFPMRLQVNNAVGRRILSNHACH